MEDPPGEERSRYDEPCLTLENFGVAYGRRVVLSRLDLQIPKRGIVTLVGPAGTGKSTLLRTLARFNKALPALRTWGECAYRNQPLADDNCPQLVGQNSRLLTATLLENVLTETPLRFASTADEKTERAMQILECVGLGDLEGSLESSVVELPLVAQRLVSIARLLPADPALLCIDEPTYGLSEHEAERILAVARREAEHRAVLIVLHNQRQMLRLGGRVALLAGGVVQEHRPVEEFFDAPATQAGREFGATGTCSDPSPDAVEQDVSTGVRPRLRPPPENLSAPSDILGPRGFAWLIPGRLGGTPRPGVVADTEYDLQALRRVGVSVLISLTSKPLEARLLEQMGLEAHWFPIPDMEAPSSEVAATICTLIRNLLDGGDVIAVHCRAGLGRTGTILAAYRIWSGRPAVEALEAVRRIEPRWVQSDPQIQFLERFGRECAETKADMPIAEFPACVGEI